jgi:hypothetical protein
VDGVYRPRFRLDPNVIRVPIVPGSDPRTTYGDLYGRCDSRVGGCAACVCVGVGGQRRPHLSRRGACIAHVWVVLLGGGGNHSRTNVPFVRPASALQVCAAPCCAGRRGVRGIVLEAFGVGNMPDARGDGWLPWLREQRKRGLLVRGWDREGGAP